MLIDTEVLSALARLERTGSISVVEADQAVHAWRHLPLTRIQAGELLGEIWALRHGVRISDANYVVLARALASPLLTADVRLARAPLPGVSVLLVN